MADASRFREVIDFFDKVGLYDVVLPFILVFTILFAILEKTKVLGTEEIDGKHYTRKNLNAMVSFVISFIVVASSKLVGIINQVSGQIVILLLLSVMFLLLVGSFYRQDEDVALMGGWRGLFMVIMFVGIVLIFLGAIENEDDDTMLEVFWDYVQGEGSAAGAVGSIVLLLILVGGMAYIVRDPPSKKAES